jgi:two-component system alkaline phosphatase synthesis response regulator PhoP
MSELMAVPPLTESSAKRTPTVYFIDDSATMREVIKIAFRRESFNVIACADAASALAQFEQNPPDAVITDVIMPDQDGYSVCTQIKQHPQFGKIPVVLMSGVVNKTVADKAVSVQADELIRKPFQPQELIGRVKALLNPKLATSAPAATDRPSFPNIPGFPASPNVPSAANALNSLFAPAPPPPPQTHGPAPPPGASEQRVPESAWPRALAEALTPPAAPNLPPTQASRPGQHNASTQPPAPAQLRSIPSNDAQKLRAEVARLELLVKKLQTELQIERQYNQALESQIHDLTHTE